jgi:hypothetical protein
MIYRILCEGREDNSFFLDVWEIPMNLKSGGAGLWAHMLPGSGLGNIASAAHQQPARPFLFHRRGLAQDRPGGPNGRSPARNHGSSGPAEESAPFSDNLSR